MADAALLREVFVEHLYDLADRHGLPLDDLPAEEMVRLARRAAEAAVAPLVWAAAVGERWDTSTVAEFLDISRQALHDRVKRGTLLGVPGRGVTWFPTWQFDLQRQRVYPVVAQVLESFRRSDVSIAPQELASWARHPQPDLGGVTPADWIAAGRPAEDVVAAARHTAARLAA